MMTYGPLIRRRIRTRLGPQMRRVVDSLDIVSTVTRRLDACIRRGGVRAESESQLFALIVKLMDNAFLEKARRFQRLRRLEGHLRDLAPPDTCTAGETAGAEEARAVWDSLENDDDRDLFVLRAAGLRYKPIAEMLGISEAASRQRWHDLRGRMQNEVRKESI